jgi:Tol biopolymer transport system component
MEAGQRRELSSWKEIASYLHVSVRTAQMWEADRGLPVKRLPGGRGVVWTNIAELEAWRKSAGNQGALGDDEELADSSNRGSTEDARESSGSSGSSSRRTEQLLTTGEDGNLDGKATVFQPAKPHRWTWIWISGSAALAIGCAVAYAYVAGFGFSRYDPPIQMVPLTTDPGIELRPDLSPDGSQVAFLKVQKEGTAELVVQPMAGGERRSLAECLSGGFPRWSPDGQWIAFMRRSVDMAELVLISPDGKNSKVITRLSGNNRPFNAWNSLTLSWTSDASAIAIAESSGQGEPLSLFLVPVGSQGRLRLTTPPAGIPGDTQPAFSPDGRWLAFARYHTGSESDLYLVPTTGGEPKPLTHDYAMIDGLSWLPDSSGLVFASNRTRGNMALWRLNLAGPEELQHLAGGDSAAASPSSVRLMGNATLRLVCQFRVRDVNLWHADIARGLMRATPIALSAMTDSNPQFSPDGRQLAFMSTRSGETEVWICNSDGTDPRQVTAMQRGFSDSPRWSPDGNWIAFTSNKGSNRDIYLVSSRGGNVRCIVEAPSEEGRPSFSRDGQWLYFRSDRSGKPQIWKTPVKGGQPAQLTFGGGYEGFESRDGKRLYYVRDRDWGGIWEVATGGGPEKQLVDGGWQGRWAVADEAIYYQGYPSNELLRYDLKTRKITDLGSLEVGHPIYPSGISVRYDGTAVVWSQIDVDSVDLAVLNLPRSNAKKWFWR